MLSTQQRGASLPHGQYPFVIESEYVELGYDFENKFLRSLMPGKSESASWSLGIIGLLISGASTNKLLKERRAHDPNKWRYHRVANLFEIRLLKTIGPSEHPGSGSLVLVSGSYGLAPLSLGRAQAPRGCCPRRSCDWEEVRYGAFRDWK